MDKNKIVFAVIGAGWRAEFFMRVAAMLPDLFEVSRVLVRNGAKADLFQKKWGIKTVTTLDQFLENRDYSYAIISVPWDANPNYIAELSKQGIPVLAETPPAPDMDGLLKLHQELPANAKVEVAEQYLYQPMHAARIRLARTGILGEVSHVQVSAAHGYHGISLIRELLGVGYEKASITGHQFTSPIVKGPGRQGLPENEEIVQSIQELAVFQFGEKTAVFDFSNVQYFSWIRGNRILVRGERGEIVNDEVSYLKDFRTPVTSRLRRIDTGHGGNLEGYAHRGIQFETEMIYENRFESGRLSDDEIAVATSMYKMGLYALDLGPSFYNFAKAAQDHYLSMMMKRSIKEGQEVVTEIMPWSSR